MTDVGLATLTDIHKQLLIDEPWTIRGDREFAWIGHRLQQTVRASDLFTDEDLSLSRITSSCVVIEDVSAPEQQVLSAMNQLNRHAVGSAYTYWPSRRKILTTAVAYVHEETLEWRSRQFGAFVISQLCLAETEADWLAEKVMGTVAARRHPTGGVRAEADDMLGVIEDVFAADGHQPSRYADEFEMDAIAESTRRSTKAASLGADANGLSIEVSFGQGTSLTSIRANEPHRRLGQGLTVRLNLPMVVEDEEANRLVALLNLHESLGSSEATHVGAWCWDEWPVTGRGVAYQLFLPNRLYQQGIAQDAALSSVKRALWADRVLNGEASKANVWQTLADRFRPE